MSICLLLLTTPSIIAQNIKGKALISEQKSKFKETGFLLKQNNQQNLRLLYDLVKDEWWEYKKKQIFNTNIEHLALLIDSEQLISTQSQYHNCLFIKLKAEKEFTICLKDEHFLDVYNLLINTAEKNQILKATLKQHQNLFQFLSRFKKPFSVVWKGKKDSESRFFQEEQERQLKSFGKLPIKTYFGEGEPAPVFKITRSLSKPSKYFDPKIWIYQAETKIKDTSTDILIKAAEITENQFETGRYDNAVLSLQREAQATAIVTDFSPAVKILDFSAWFGELQQSKRLLNLTLALEYTGFSLDQFYKRGNDGFRLTLEQDKNIISQILKMITDLHKKGYYHFNLNAQNITIKKQDNNKNPYQIKLNDFSKLHTSILYRMGKNPKNNIFTFPENESIGSPGYIQNCILTDPKKTQETPPTSLEEMEKKDSFALGMTLIYTIYWKHLDPNWTPPKRGPSECKAIKEFIVEFYPYNIDTPFLVDKGLNELTKIIYQMIAPNFKDRITVKEAANQWEKLLLSETKRSSRK